MASKVTLSFLIVVTIALLGICYLMLRREKVEGFANAPYSVKDLSINTCPTNTTEIQTTKGSTDCCEGDIVNGKCNGTTFCTQSDPYDNVSSCYDAWRKYFTDKGTNVCPATMPNYYEDVSSPSGLKGCSAGPISQDGKMPTDSIMKQCKIYATEQDNLSKLDSCYTEKQRAKIQCPLVNGKSPEATSMMDHYSNMILFKCEYPFELGMPSQCFEKTSFYAYLDKVLPNWRMSNTNANDNICDNYIARRQTAQVDASRLLAEQKAREAAEAQAKTASEAQAKAEEDAKKKANEASRLQQQLDTVNSQLQQCKK